MVSLFQSGSLSCVITNNILLSTGQVPDRGGRTAEAIQPQQETFTQQQQQRQQQKNRGGFQQGNQNRQNFNSSFNPNRVQGSGWNPNSNRDWNPNSNRDFSGQQGEYFK